MYFVNPILYIMVPQFPVYATLVLLCLYQLPSSNATPLPQRMSTEQFLAFGDQQNQLFWKSWHRQLNTYVTSSMATIGSQGQSAHNLHLMLTAGVAERHDFGKPKGSAARNWAIWSAGDQIPANITQGHMGSLFSTYRDFVNAIKTTNDNDNGSGQAELDAGRQGISAKAKELQQLRIEAKKDYDASQPGIPFEDFLSANYPHYASLKAEVDGMKTETHNVELKVNIPGFDKVQSTLTKLDSAGKDKSKTIYNMVCREENGVKSYCPKYNLQGDAVIDDWKSANSTERKISMKIESTAADEKSKDWAFSTGPSIPFIDLGGTEGTGQKLTKNLNYFSAEISFSQIGSFPIPPGVQFFGENDSLSRIVQRVVVGYKPKASVTVNKEFYEEYKTQLKSSAGIGLSLGPIKIDLFRVKTATNTTTVDHDIQQMPTISFEDSDPDAFVVLGYLVSKIN
ncbi:hypothetical protein BKA69DRAFT_1059384 [Paraphysoderma sedebokerense]|nr:hypothetical protein BKA69DRAFT_1059384 [Paraphysoderma sedebokerense]